MNYKAHIVLVAAIAVFIGILALVGQMREKAAMDKLNDPALKVDDTFYVDIESATYGTNCHGQDVTSSAARPDSSQLGSDGKYRIVSGNATDAVSRLCQQQKTCSISVSERSLGFDPASGCAKSLDVSYRCFSFDKLRTASAAHRDKLTLDCIPAASGY